jgi:hypothetical protein
MIAGQRIPFDAVSLNIGDHFQTTGTFKCTVSGTYLFLAELVKSDINWYNFKADIQLNGQSKSKTVTAYSAAKAAADAMCIFHCGKTMWCRLKLL